VATVSAIPTLTEDLPAHEELQGSPVSELTSTGFRSTRKLKCAWSDQLKLAAQLLGGSFGQTGSPGSEQVLYALPHAHPLNPAAFARSVGFAPFGQSPRVTASANSDRVASYDYAELSVQYGTPDGDGQQQPKDGTTLLYEERLEPSTEYITVASNLLSWSAAGPPIDPLETPGVAVSILDYSIAVEALPSFHPNAVLQIGVCNAGAVLAKSLNVTMPPETLLYHGFFPNRVTTTGGTLGWSGSFRLTYKPSGWNKFWRSGFSTPQTLYSYGTGTPWKPVPVVAFDFLP
jgi:hypothetical protein